MSVFIGYSQSAVISFRRSDSSRLIFFFFMTHLLLLGGATLLSLSPPFKGISLYFICLLLLVAGQRGADITSLSKIDLICRDYFFGDTDSSEFVSLPAYPD